MAREKVLDPHPLAGLAQKAVAGAPGGFLDARLGLVAMPRQRLVADPPCTTPIGDQLRLRCRTLAQAMVNRQRNNRISLGMRPMKKRKTIGPA